MKKINTTILVSFLVFFITFSCNEIPQDVYEQNGETTSTKSVFSSMERSNVATFEKVYIQTYMSDNNNDIKLLGYKTMMLNGEERENFKRLYEMFKEEIDAERGVYIASDTSFYRIYYPMNTAIVNLNGMEYTADENGVISVHPQVLSRASNENMSIVARVKSDKVTGCGSNIITDTRIIMKDAILPIELSNNKYVFDMGDINCCTGWTRAGSAPCTQNHGIYANCSDAFRIWGNNCVTRRDVCMDFNGFGSDCVKGPKKYFIGSDCQRAMALGHCWNEIM